jgi:hypothetical protein
MPKRMPKNGEEVIANEIFIQIYFVRVEKSGRSDEAEINKVARQEHYYTHRETDTPGQGAGSGMACKAGFRNRPHKDSKRRQDAPEAAQRTRTVEIRALLYARNVEAGHSRTPCCTVIS